MYPDFESMAHCPTQLGIYYFTQFADTRQCHVSHYRGSLETKGFVRFWKYLIFKIKARNLMEEGRYNMESNEKVELISRAIQKLIEEKKNNKDASAQDDEFLLSSLLSQLESLKGEESFKQSEGVNEREGVTTNTTGETETKVENAGETGTRAEEITNELKKVKRQNLITHCLLSAMIVLTVAWQFSEVKLLMKLKDGFNHPFRSVGGMITGMLKPQRRNGHEPEKQNHDEGPSLNSIQMPELPHLMESNRNEE